MSSRPPRPDRHVFVEPPDLAGNSIAALADLFNRWLADPDAVHPSWHPWFAKLGHVEGVGQVRPADATALREKLGLIFRLYGHLAADLDPLGRAQRPFADALELTCRAAVPAADHAAVLAEFRSYYCGSVGYEFMHIHDPVRRDWLQARIEQPAAPPAPADRVRAAEGLVAADSLEGFMQSRFPNKKRFGAEGAETLIPLLEALLRHGVADGVRSVIAGGTSRARLNVLVNVFGKPLEALFAEVGGQSPAPVSLGLPGDVPYHFGYAGDRWIDGSRLELRFAANPSHLEAVDAVVMGMLRASQEAWSDPVDGRRRVAGLLLHTDAAFAGQGVVAETMQLSGLPGYRVGGIVHVVINNQIGFTTSPAEARTSHYCTDVAKAVGAPVFHINGDDPDAALGVAALAMDYRAAFGGDVVIDLVCYRRRGHNELDEPSFTDPALYDAIAAHPGVLARYLRRLQDEGIVTAGWAERTAAACRTRLETGYARASAWHPEDLPDLWPGRPGPAGSDSARFARSLTETASGVPLAQLRTLGRALARLPDGFTPAPKVARFLQERRRTVDSGRAIGWAFAEALALGSLLCEAIPVRLSGQDTLRGAFTQRHLVLVDRQSETRHVPLNALQSGQARLEAINSPLMEYAALGYEYGHAVARPHGLTIWEAQFGDFANVGQAVIDQFIASAAEKWGQHARLVVLLPHGLEGQGPDHSSARIERILQLCARGNLTVAACSTPANFFHLLRAHAKAGTVPLIAATPKSLLRHRSCVSDLTEFTDRHRFRPVLDDWHAARRPDAVRRVVLCSGKLFFELDARRAEQKADHVALLRVEQLYPYPADALAEALARYPNCDLVWCQEEPENMGPWTYLQPRLARTLDPLTRSHLKYVGRPESASPGSAAPAAYAREQTAILDEALA